ncbi:phosphoenolpyruvate carboxylase, partial [Acidithiobacillus ferridurans]
SLRGHNDGYIADNEVQEIIWLVQTFGFHLANLDIRQESSVHSRTIAELFAGIPGFANYLELSEEARILALSDALRRPGPLVEQTPD